VCSSRTFAHSYTMSHPKNTGVLTFATMGNSNFIYWGNFVCGMSLITLQHVHPWHPKFCSSWNDLRIIIITIDQFRNVSAVETPWLYLTYRSIKCVVSKVSHFLIRCAELQTKHTECTDLERYSEGEAWWSTAVPELHSFCALGFRHSSLLT